MILSYKLFESVKDKELVVCVGDVDDLSTHNHIGHFFIGQDGRTGIDFLNKFSSRLHNLYANLKGDSGWYVDKDFIKPFINNETPKTFPLIYFNKMKEILSYSINFLLDYEKIYYSDISFIAPTNRNDTISCLSYTNYQKLENKDDVWKTPMRQNMRIGGFIKKILPDDSNLDIEKYVNNYKFSYNVIQKEFGDFKKVFGEDIRKWYLEMSYAPGGGTLNQSCMKHFKSQKRLSLYIENPNKVRLLILKNPQGKLLGRALLWKLDEPNRIFMDRVYVAEDYLEKMFLDYAKKFNILTRQDIGSETILKVFVKKDYGASTQNPYMDTLKFFVKNGNYLTNKFKNFKAGEFYEYIDHD